MIVANVAKRNLSAAVVTRRRAVSRFGLRAVVMRRRAVSRSGLRAVVMRLWCQNPAIVLRLLRRRLPAIPRFQPLLRLHSLHRFHPQNLPATLPRRRRVLHPLLTRPVRTSCLRLKNPDSLLLRTTCRVAVAEFPFQKWLTLSAGRSCQRCHRCIEPEFVNEHFEHLDLRIGVFLFGVHSKGNCCSTG